jgi:hypothetical protein
MTASRDAAVPMRMRFLQRALPAQWVLSWQPARVTDLCGFLPIKLAAGTAPERDDLLAVLGT